MVALAMLLKMKATGRGPNIVARELALLLARAPFVQIVCEHCPGVANVMADRLSRLHAPERAKTPEALAGVTRVHPPLRVPTLFQAAAAPWPGAGHDQGQQL